jgi:hypothetical protein
MSLRILALFEKPAVECLSVPAWYSGSPGLDSLIKDLLLSHTYRGVTKVYKKILIQNAFAFYTSMHS